MKTEKRKNSSMKQYAFSVLLFLLCYYILFGGVLLLLYINNPSNYHEFMRDHVSELAYMFVCILLLYIIFYLYYLFENREILKRTKDIVMLFAILYVCMLISYFMGRYLNVYARPVALLALLVLFLRNRREAIFMNFMYSLLMFVIDSFANPQGFDSTYAIYSSLIMSFSAGMVAVFIGSGIKTRFAIVWAGLIVTVPVEIIVAMFSYTTFADANISKIVQTLGFGFIGGMGSSVIFLTVLPIYEIAFGCLTSFRLRELTGLNVKLLKQLKEEAPGTFNHSMVVAQLAETCAASLGENPELARAAAYYHDVGKLAHPEFFTENQTNGNPHDELAPEISVNLIRSHTRKGYNIILKNHLPKYFAEVALRHHGTMPIKYFYAKALKMSDGEVNIADYSYQEAKPLDKITAIIMIADASEAATRSLPHRTEEKIEAVVRSIIEERVDLDQFSECDITMKELTTIKTTIVNALSGVYHHRVKYPDIRINRSSKADNNEK